MNGAARWEARSNDPTLAEHVCAELDGIAPWRQQFDRDLIGVIERLIDWSRAHWLLLANAAMALTLIGAVAAPALRAIGLDGPAFVIHWLYLLLCPQRPTHSYFVFGYQLALEQRMIAMFAAQLAGGLAYGVVRQRVRGLNWRHMVVLSLPMAWDGFSQRFGLRDSDWLMRTWTGGLFNLALVFWGYPFLDRMFRAQRLTWRSVNG